MASSRGAFRGTVSGKEPEILFTHLMEGIGLALNLKGGRMFITDFGGSVYSANLDGSNRKTLLFCGRKPHRHCIRGGAVRILSDNAGRASLCSL